MSHTLYFITNIYQNVKILYYSNKLKDLLHFKYPSQKREGVCMIQRINAGYNTYSYKNNKIQQAAAQVQNPVKNSSNIAFKGWWEDLFGPSERTLDSDLNPDLKKLMGSYLNAFKENNQTSIALTKEFPLMNEYHVLSTIPFSSDRKYSSVNFEKLGSFVLGAPEYIYTKYQDKTIIKYIKEKTNKGYRVILLCRLNDPIDEKKKSLGRTIPVAIFSLEDHIRDDASSTIDWFINNNVNIKIISGDNPYTASEIAHKCHVPNAEHCISLTDNEVDMFGKLMSIPDNMISRYYSLLTDATKEELETIDKQIAEGSVNPRDIKMKLAYTITAEYHGEEGAKRGQDAFVNVVSNKGIPDDIEEVSGMNGKGILDALVELKFTSSRGEAKRLIQGGGVKLDGEKITDTAYVLSFAESVVLQAGKRKFAKLI